MPRVLSWHGLKVPYFTYLPVFGGEKTVPIYEYQCQSCGHEMEALQKMADDPLKDCPACEQAALKKLISAAAFKLTGTGWYETDFKTKKSDAGQADKSSASDGPKSATSTSQAGSATDKQSATSSAPTNLAIV